MLFAHWETVDREVSKLSDEAYRTLFVKKLVVIEIETDEATGKEFKRILSDEEKKNLKPAEDGKVHIATNGIFNNEEEAAKYARQHSVAKGPQYLVYFHEADNAVSELMVAAYQKYLEGDALGLSTPTTEIKRAMEQYGQSGLHLDGHSRGSLTIGNALESKAKEDQAQGSLSGTTVSFFGPAYNAAKADGLLGVLQNREATADVQVKLDSVLKFQNHVADPVGTYVGDNPATGGTIPEGSTVLGEMHRAISGKRGTSHNCYGEPKGGGNCDSLWKSDVPKTLPANQTRDQRGGSSAREVFDFLVYFRLCSVWLRIS